MKGRLLFCLCTAAFLLFLPGCKTKAAPLRLPSQLDQPFKAKAIMEYDGLNISALFSKEAENRFCLEFQEPETLEGMSMLFEADQVTISYRGLTGSYRPGSLPQAAVGQLLTEAVGLLCRGEKLELELDGSALKATGVLAGKEDSFAAVIDASSGTLQTLAIPDRNFEVTFEDFSFQ